MEMKCGIEIHQRLATKEKLFCACRAGMEDEPVTGTVKRRLHAVSGELGVVDPAALFEARRERAFTYQFFEKSTCLVEADEEPPHELNLEALEIALQVSKMLHSRIVDEVHVMRKTVVDGSSPSGFQRTALIALGGYVETSFGKVGIQTVCLEEESAGIVGQDGSGVTYRLDRLGIPLVEIATAPEISSGKQAREIAEKIGTLLRNTGKVQRGIGSIRQDVNISVGGGARVEIKGAQELDSLARLVENEAGRQRSIAGLAKKVKKIAEMRTEIVDVTAELSKSGFGFISKHLSEQNKALGIALHGFGGVLGAELSEGCRFGTELSGYAKAAAGVGGIIHSDEDTEGKYAMGPAVRAAIEKKLGCQKKDAWVICIASEEKARLALEAVAGRAARANEGVLKETRKASGDGTEYMRPLPGSARMYPETDVPPVAIGRKAVESIELPEALGDRVSRYQKMGLAQPVATNIARDHAGAFDTFAKTGADPVFVAATLSETFTALRRRGANVEEIGQGAMAGFFEAYKNGKFTKAAAPAILERMAKPEKLEAVLDAGLKRLARKEVRAIVDGYKKKNPEASAKGLFGIIIREHRLVVDAGDLEDALETAYGKTRKP